LENAVVRFVDRCWLHFVKTSVPIRCQTRCLYMLVWHHSMPWSIYLEIYFKRGDSWIFSEDLFHVKSWPRSVFLEADNGGLYLACSLRMLLQHFKETSDLLQNICAEISWFSWMSGTICASSPFCNQAI